MTKINEKQVVQVENYYNSIVAVAKTYNSMRKIENNTIQQDAWTDH